MSEGWTRRSVMAALAGAATLGAWEGRATSPPERLDPHLFDGLLADAGGAPGLGGAVVDSSGLRAIGVAGVRRLGGAEPIGIDDQWHLGSNAKALTATLYALLVEAGLTAWQRPIADLFPDLQVHPAWRDIRIEAALSHGAGIRDDRLFSRAWYSAAYRDRRPVTEQRTAFAQQLLSSAPAGPVGTYSYANAGYMLVGAAIERIAGMAWEQALSSRLFQPLGLASAGFFAPVGAQPWGHARAGSGLRPIDPSGLSDNPAVMGPSGQVHLSLADYAKFLRLFLADGGGVLTRQSIEHLSAPQPSQGGNYALGWVVSGEPWGNGPILSHQGSNTLWHAVAQLAPARGLGFIGIANAAPRGSNRAAARLVANLTQRFAGTP